MRTAQVIITSCSRRELEIGQMRDFLRGNGYHVSDDDWSVDKEADLIFLSTCGFTKAAEDFGFETLHRIRREKKHSAQVVLCGCIPEINPRRTIEEFGGETFSPQSYAKLNDIIRADRPFEEFKRPNQIRSKSSIKDNLKKAIELFKTFDGSFSGLQNLTRRLGNKLTRKVIRRSLANLVGNKTFYIQIQEGCSMDCSYCSIKTAIGKLRSKPIASVLNDFKNGLHSGFTEFQLVGDNAGSYGLDIGTNLRVLLDEISKLDGKFKLDLTDINPAYIPIIFSSVKHLCSNGKLARLYVPIQSGNPRVLKLMKRGSDMEQVKKMLIEIREAASSNNKFMMGTSVIVGFPSETNEELQETIKFCKDVKFDWVWCHSFSARPETPAADMPNQIGSGEILRHARLFKKKLSGTTLVTTADDNAGSRTCQG
jgi:tRNA A37 methylthiotransferase MiaB